MKQNTGRPDSLNISGCPYKVTYHDNQINVDPEKRYPYFGCHDPLTRSISIYDKDLPIEALWQEIFHEVLHAISFSNSLDILDINSSGDITGEQKHDQLDSLATALTDFLFRNDLIKVRK